MSRNMPSSSYYVKHTILFPTLNLMMVLMSNSTSVCTLPCCFMACFIYFSSQIKWIILSYHILISFIWICWRWGSCQDSYITLVNITAFLLFDWSLHKYDVEMFLPFIWKRSRPATAFWLSVKALPENSRTRKCCCNKERCIWVKKMTSLFMSKQLTFPTSFSNCWKQHRR